MRAVRVLCAVALLAWGGAQTISEAQAAPKKQPLKRKPRVVKKAPKKTPSTAELAEEELHAERLAFIGRLKEIVAKGENDELAELVSVLTGLENERAELARDLLSRSATAEPAEKAAP